MPRFRVPDWVKKATFNFSTLEEVPERLFEEVRAKFKRFRDDNPEVSIVIPVWNEEKNLLNTLYTFANQETSRRVEILVVNNNSQDRTQEILDRCGVLSVFEAKQGITNARQAGLDKARGKYFLAGDGDSLYPPRWCDLFCRALDQPGVSVAYGRYSFIPPEGSSRLGLGVYEILAETLFDLRRRHREYLNVMGFTSGFKTEDARSIGGYNKKRQVWEDGWMALALRERGRIVLIKSDDARVWTSPRRLLADGSIQKAFLRRVKKEITRVGEYVMKKPIKYN